MGKLPTEEIAKNIAGHAYTVDGKMKTNRKAPASPRVQEMLELSKAIKESFQMTGDAPQTRPEFYRAGKMLGRGAFGKVNLGMHKLTRKLIAIKSINKEYLSEEKQKSKIMHEV
jgi:serine/threonine protein kinase